MPVGAFARAAVLVAIAARVMVTNAPASAVYVAAGFRRAKLLREAAWIDQK